MKITSEKKAIGKLEEGFKLEEAVQFKRRFYYLTNYKDTEITVSKSVIAKMREKGLIDSNDCYKKM